MTVLRDPMVWFVSRHPGAVKWAARQQIVVDRLIAHLDVQELVAGDTVIGTLPIALAAEVCARGCRFVNLTLEVPFALRGKELSADDLDLCRARLERFHIEKLADGC
jgi:CRISPR-associated protein Csx16